MAASPASGRAGPTAIGPAWVRARRAGAGARPSPALPVRDRLSRISLAQGILVARLERETTGVGKWVHTSLLEAMLSMLDFQASRWLMSGEVPPQAGNHHPTRSPTGVFETRDGHINVAAAGDDLY